MPGFNAATVVEPLDYDFRTNDNPGGKVGVIREPGDEQIAAYLAGVKQLLKDFRGQLPDDLISGTADMGAIMAATEELDEELTVKFQRSLAGIVAALCSDDPSEEDIMLVPPRIRAVFFNWIQREVMSPEAVPGGGNAQVRTLRPAAAG